jgi:hypothetical protein
VCTAYLGWEEDLVVSPDSDTLARYHLRTLTYDEAVRSGRLTIEGSRSAVRAFVGCIRPSPYALPR